ncbi:hypothetical protein QAD02_021904 [Eretmocerus hayati]|uniref:Uncharacterized protein n=2 Tax=Eretmocerus hayati TaxID=131215 RepID=A0ACC2N3U8_9HYME|nr:hypothetical protein QAD02_007384 [Eretmocerus hayati]KAJ8686110.1 hypothetical protein QAD02_021904 [Eretmocerus hayati]
MHRIEKLEKGIAPPTASSLEEISAEMQDRVSRINNLIMYNVAEVDANGARMNDLIQVQSLLRNIKDVTLDGIKVRRIGLVKEGKSRPLFIEMRSHYDVMRVIGSKKFLPTGISVSTDRTKAQRDHLSSLRAEVSRINDAKGSRVKTIRYVNGKPCIVDLAPAKGNSSLGAGPQPSTSKND